MSGQIQRGSKMGELLYQICSIKEFKNIVEFGAWDGQGSTKCIMDAILQRNDDSILYSLEAEKEFYDKAVSYWNPIVSLIRGRKKLELIFGRITNIDELLSEQDIRNHPCWNLYGEKWIDWRNGNIQMYEKCSNVFQRIPTDVDVLVLDGGNYSTAAEWEKLKDRTKVVFGDDSTTIKTSQIREEVLRSDDWKMIEDDLNDRQGFFVACKKEYYDLIKESLK